MADTLEPLQTVPCADCPFDRPLSRAELVEASEGAPETMLCHRSGCLDGDGPDLRCRGYHDARGAARGG